MLETVDLSLALDRDTYSKQLNRRQVQLRELSYQVYLQKRPVVFVFEGWDAAGKGGSIKRLTARMDPRGYVVYPIGAPEGEDKTHHYLYRFWRRLPERGQIAIFDRSWYGRALVERVEGFCPEAAWRRAFREINSFERQLVEFGMILVKFWVHIGRDEQLRRFEERERIAYKSWKLTREDWRNRDKWPIYEQAVEDMLLKTSTVTAPWTVVEGNNKYWARVKVCATVVEVLSRELNYRPIEPLEDGDEKKAARKNTKARQVK
jgi:polyphosphate kinase 2 (PPK2 family)